MIVDRHAIIIVFSFAHYQVKIIDNLISLINARNHLLRRWNKLDIDCSRIQHRYIRQFRCFGWNYKAVTLIDEYNTSSTLYLLQVLSQTAAY